MTLIAAALLLAVLPLAATPAGAAAPRPAEGAARRIVLACRADNDLFLSLGRALRRRCVRRDTPAAAIQAARPGDAALLLADGYPDDTTPLDAAILAEAERKRLKLYVEYPRWLPDQAVGAPATAEWSRGVVASDWFGAALPRLRLLAIHGCRFVPARARAPHIVYARVAGYDTAIYGLPVSTHPILFEARPGLLAATTKLSQFVTARYAPSEAWTAIWRAILDWADPGGADHTLRWRPAVRPSYSRDAKLPADAERRALQRGIAWYSKARMIVHPDWEKVNDVDAAAWPDRTGPRPHDEWPCGDGALGILEGFNARIDARGEQPVRWWRRNDCIGEFAGTLALAGKALGDKRSQAIAANAADYLYTKSILSQGKRADPANPAYGLIGWNDVPRYWGALDGYGVYYGDDNARSLLGMMLAASVLRTDRWDDRIARCLLANLRLTSRRGFQPDRIDEGTLEQTGWRRYYEGNGVSLSPHYQAYMWACDLWAYRQSGYAPFLERARAGIAATMEAYPDRWTGPGDLEMARARMVLPLAWLVRIEDTPQHRLWLRTIVEEILKRQDACGALRQDLPGPAMTEALAPPSNEAYGTTEAPLIHSVDDPCADLLYTNNFALLGLHEAVAATGDRDIRAAENRLAAFLCRAQIRSEKRPELDGAWFRAFDFGRWDYWASNADAGWGAWCIETGWTQTWITGVLAMRLLGTSLWDATASSSAGAHIRALQPVMLPDNPSR